MRYNELSNIKGFVCVTPMVVPPLYVPADWSFEVSPATASAAKLVNRAVVLMNAVYARTSYKVFDTVLDP